MITGKPLTIQKEKIDYRALKALNQSAIKTFDEDPLAFYNEHILGIKRKKRKSGTGDGILIGDLADFYTLDCDADEDQFMQRVDEKFTIFEGAKGTGQVFLLADTLAEITERDTNDKGVVTTTLMSRFEEAFSIVQDLGKYSKKLLKDGFDDFEKNGREYFEKKIESFKKEVVTLKLVDIAKRVGNQLVSDPFTAWTYQSTPNIEVFKKFPITWVYKTVKGEEILCKSEVDILHVDHKEKLIYIKDQKVLYDNEIFDYIYLKNGYYFQNAFYYMAVEYWMEEQGMNNYQIVPGMDFVVGDSSFNGRRPLIYKTSMKHIEQGINGFESKYGQKYRGINELIEEISFCIDNSSWNCGKEAFENNGIIKLKDY